MFTRTTIISTLAALAASASIAAPALAQESGATTGPSRVTTIRPVSDKSAKPAATIPIATADYNRSGTVDTQDIFDYLNGWFAGSPTCDTNGNGVLEGLDILEYINRWFAAPAASVEAAG